jgi:hypothetical protein
MTGLSALGSSAVAPAGIGSVTDVETAPTRLHGQPIEMPSAINLGGGKGFILLTICKLLSLACRKLLDAVVL